MAHSRARSKSSRPVRASRTKVQTYHEESDSNDDLTDRDNLGGERLRPSSVSLRPRNTSGTRRSYREDSSDEDPEDVSEEDENQDTVPISLVTDRVYAAMSGSSGISHSTAAPKLARSSRRSRPTTRSQPRRPTTSTQKSHKGLGQPLKKRTRIDAGEELFLNSGVIPPWPTLPYHILLDIFVRASYPLVNEQLMTRTKSVKWLVDIALLCRGFLEPALTALYHSPPLIPVAKSHDLLKLLSMPQETLALIYSSKVKELHVDAETVLFYKSGPQLGYFDFPQMIEKTPQVQTVRLYHKDDFIIGVPSFNIPQSKWTYPESLFSAIDWTGIALRSWDWNGRFLNTLDLLPFMLEKHQRASFQTLKHLRLVHVDDYQRDDTSTLEATLAASIQELPQLESLELIECTLISKTIFLQLPPNLRSLSLSNCERVFTESLTDFLRTCGGNLQELSLSHNRHLTMSFITNLADYCPKLEKFKMDISIHDWSSYNNTKPHFQALLSRTEIPTWPETLQEIELIQLKRIDAPTAEMVFMSLIDAAPRLRYLRRLTLSVILEIAWRERATLRERWIHQFEATFLRRSAPPDPNFRSLRKRPLKSISHTTDSGVFADESSRPGSAGSDLLTPSKRHSVRLAQHKESPALALPRQSEPSFYGMCDIVNVRIDNQRPTETQLNENDFLDEEASGDEDWDGDDWEPADRHAW
ncbi:hypothetical protein N7462_008981 [Penicillium macrosclerotiorum]|uniref:uncharacterized protein n=1 Tax=Penicillium macrosclerotiorum TaxID=303699 RepID=UPI002548FB57|nr:uncharacterized protein N7462_008981 [Penicillium macrosclerotiorum]KAJ5676084.1 hypothetical protein N7462_008981 [Penicillium macrosclerotiorum]